VVETFTSANFSTAATTRRSFHHDPQLRPIVGTLTIAGKGTFTSATYYDEQGRAAQSISPSGYIQKTEYQAAGTTAATYSGQYAKRIYDNDGAAGAQRTHWSATARYLDGQIQTMVVGANMTTGKGYDGFGRVSSITTTATGATQGNLQSATYSFDAMGNLMSRADTAAAAMNDTFTYDLLNRLLTSAGTSPAAMTYTDNGNINTKDGVQYAYITGTHKLCKTAATAATDCTAAGTGITYAYDGLTVGNTGTAGNVTTISNGGGVGGSGTATSTTTLAGYTPWNMPTTITKTFPTAGPGGTALTNSLTYTYDASHSRVVEQSSVHGTTLYLGGYERIDRSTAGSGNAQQYIEHRNYIATPEGIVGIITTRAPPADVNGVVATSATLPAGISATELRYWLKDHLGSIVATTDDLAAVQQRFRYDAWGKRVCALATGALSDICGAGGGVNGANTLEERGFTGHEMLDEVGLIHMNGRLYDATTGRFLQSDPIIQDAYSSQSYNRYSYVLNNPLSFTDPSGFSWWTKWRRPIFALVAAIAVPWLATEFMLGSNAAWGAGLAAEGGMGTSVLTSAGQAIANVAGGLASGGISGGNVKSALIGVDVEKRN
jgi:RHS repeat-associated protein